MLLELLTHETASFVTLTYSDEHVPKGGTLRPEDMQKFLKLLRYYLPGRRIRYYGVGEYGEKNWRPHFHLILYGVSPVESGVVEKAWRKGIVHVGTAEPESMSYVAGYITKKMTKATDPRLKGVLRPEFARMSRGLGEEGGKRFAQALLSNPVVGASLMDGSFFPMTFQVGQKKFPIDRFIKERLRLWLRIPEKARRRWFRENVVEPNWALNLRFSKELREDRQKRRQVEELKLKQQKERLL